MTPSSSLPPLKTVHLFRDRAFILAACALVLILCLATWDWFQVQAAEEYVQSTDDAIRQTVVTFSTLKDAETGQRGYLLTSNPAYLTPYHVAQTELTSQLHALGVLVAQDPQLAPLFQYLQSEISAKMNELQLTVALQQQNHSAGALAIVNGNAGLQHMGNIRRTINQLHSRLQQELESRRREAQASMVRARVVSVGASCALFILVGIATLKLKREKEAAEAANQFKSLFLANMSHELRTPLNAILGYSDMLLEEAESDDQFAFIPDLQKIRTAGKHLLELINAVLDLSKVESGKMDLYLENFSVHELVSEVLSVSRPLIERNNNSLTTSIDPAVGSMRTDQLKLRQCLLNLLSNASKFTSNGTVNLNVSKVGDETINFVVTDTGIGISKEHLSHIFEPFIQGDPSTTRKFGGSGLGLAITRRFTHLMGGEIFVASEQGVGTSFTLTLPRILETDQAAGQSDSALATTKQQQGMVLIIDDDATIHDLLRRNLAKLGFGIEGAFGGEEGLRLARRLRPRTIILDVMMPGMDGWSVLSALKNDPETADIPVIMLTIVDDKNMGFSLGAAEYLTKPIDRNRLVSVLMQYRRPSGNVALVVDDDLPTREMLCRFLEADDWKVVQADNGRIALGTLSSVSPNLILLDLMMPEMDGFEFLESIHNHPAWRNIPVIVITAKNLTEEDHQRLNGDVTRVLEKGLFKVDELLAQVKDVISRPGRIPGESAST